VSEEESEAEEHNE